MDTKLFRLALWPLVVGFSTIAPVRAQLPDTLLHALYNPETNPNPNSFYGYAVAVDGNFAAVGDSFGGLVAVHDATTGALIHTINHPNPTVGSFIGNSVALSNTRLIAGARFDDTGADGAGTAYVYELSGVAPTVPIITLTNPCPIASGIFGSSVAISGVRVVAAAVTGKSGVTGAGEAYVFDLSSAIPEVPIVTLTNPTPATNDFFGYPVAISGNIVVAGASWDDVGAFRAGIVYVYDLSSSTPAVPFATLTNPSPAAMDVFGQSLAVCGTHLVVAAEADDTGAENAGSVYVYDLANGAPAVPILTINNPTPLWNENFGRSVAISGTRLVVGAHLEYAGVLGWGAAYVFDLASATPTVPVARLANPSPLNGEQFGHTVAICGSRIVVSDIMDQNFTRHRGAAYIFGPRPALSMLPAGPDMTTVSWFPPATSGFVLQSTDSLAPANWVNAPTGATNPATLATTNGARFFRLVQP